MSQLITVRDELTGKTSRIDLMQYLSIKKHIHRMKSVPSPSAPISELLQTGDVIKTVLRSAEETIQAKRDTQPRLSLIIDLLFFSGCRISEVLDITGTDINQIGSVRIRGKKGSKSRIIKPSFTRDILMRYQGRLSYIFHDYSRHFVYRELRKCGLYHSIPGNKKQATTHLGRHIMGSEVHNSTNDINLTQSTLGHVNQKSTKSYIKLKR